MSKHDLEKLIHAFIFSRVDNCDDLFTGLHMLQFLQKTKELTKLLRFWSPYTGL